jgi:hypothetical protein
MANNESTSIINKERETVQKSTIFNEFFWICSGANRSILRQCPSEYAKYFGIGGTIFFTALMATFSGGYAIFTVFKNQYIAIVLGIMWGLLIFNLDRFIVNTMYTDGHVTISRREFLSGLPRIIIALFLGIVISTPLELKIFEDEINVTIQEMAAQRKDQYIAKDQMRIDSLKMRKDNISERPLSYQDERITSNESTNILINNRKEKTSEYNQKEQEAQQLLRQISSLQQQMRATSDSSTHRRLASSISNVRGRYNALRQEIRRINSEISTLNGQLAAQDETSNELMSKAREARDKELEMIQNEIDTLQSRFGTKSSAYNEMIDKEFGGFQAHMLAFSKMKEDNPSTLITSWFIMLLFIIIEIVPTVFKMMVARGPYDDLLAAENRKLSQEARKAIDDIDTSISIYWDKNAERRETERVLNHDILERLSGAQSELMNTAIERWREEELKKIQANPYEYIQSNTNSDPSTE